MKGIWDLKEISGYNKNDSAGFKQRLKIQGQLTEAFGIERSLRQDDALSTALLCVILEKVVRNIQTNSEGTIFNRTRQHIAHAVDVWVAGRWMRAMFGVLTEIREAAVSTGVVMNGRRTKYMKMNRKVTTLERDLIMNGQVLEGGHSFIYLGALINKKKLVSDEMKSRTAASN